MVNLIYTLKRVWSFFLYDCPKISATVMTTILCSAIAKHPHQLYYTDAQKTKREKSNTFWDQCELSISTERYYGSVPWLDRQRPGGDLFNKSLKKNLHQKILYMCTGRNTENHICTDEGGRFRFPPPDSLLKRLNYATIWCAQVKASGLVIYCMNR